MGGSDQWGNIVTGTELIRRKANGEAFAFTCPLITKADGGKFGKTESGNILLDPQKTSPYQFYQFWLNASDTDAEKWIRIFSFLPFEEIEKITNEHEKNPSQRFLQQRLAEEITAFVHGKNELEKAVETTKRLFTNHTAPVESLSEQDLEQLEGIIQTDFEKIKLNAGIDVVSFLSETNIFPSKGEARKTIQGGGVSINRRKVDSIAMKVDTSLLLHEKYILVQKGKNNYYLVRMG